MSELQRSSLEAAARAVMEAGKPPSQWTDNVARVYAVKQRHPEVEVVWPKGVRGRVFRATWPGGEAETGQLADLADILESTFPEA